MVGGHLAGQIPAVIREVCERSKLAAIANHGDADKIHAQDLLTAAGGMREQMALLSPQEPDDRSDMEKAAEVLGTLLADNTGAEPEGVVAPMNPGSNGKPTVQVRGSNGPRLGA